MPWQADTQVPAGTSSSAPRKSGTSYHRERGVDAPSSVLLLEHGTQSQIPQHPNQSENMEGSSDIGRNHRCDGVGACASSSRSCGAEVKGARGGHSARQLESSKVARVSGLGAAGGCA
eukprot:692444-Amphidinium_carterae.1